MNTAQTRTVEIKLRAVAAEAESLADDVRRSKLWEGELEKRLAGIQENLNGARAAATRQH